MAKRKPEPWEDDYIDPATGRKPWGRTWKPDPLLDYNEAGQLIKPPSRILTDVELQNPEPPSRRGRTRLKMSDNSLVSSI
jgi:hypothetical protein